jgi:hypothetical protein
VILVLGNAEGGDAVESILNTIKKLLGIDSEDDSFDVDVMAIINSTIPALSQMGIGPANGFIVTSADNTWNEYIGNSTINLEGVKTYLYLKTKLIFDPPTNSTVIDAFNKNLNELEWRMMLAVETNNLEV